MDATPPDPAPVPDHVPSDLIREFPFARGLTTSNVPHDQLNCLSSGPDVFFVRSWPTPAGTWVVRRPEQWRELVMDAEHLTSSGFTPFAKLAGGQWKMIPIEIDPPEHFLYRSILNPLLSPKAIAALDEKIVGYARDCVRAFRARGDCEFMKEFSFEYPIRIFLELMGLPLERSSQFLQWERGLLYAASLDEMTSSVTSIVDYLKSEIAARRDAPQNGFIDHLLGAEVNGRKLDDDELLGICFTLFVGGLDTVSVHLAFMIRHLAEHPDQQEYLRANPDKIPDAIEELFRLYGTAGSLRTCIKELKVSGATIKPGDKVMTMPALAGRDAAEYAEPLEVRFDRAARHVSFGSGPHTCIGMHLARRELRAAIGAMLELLPPFRIASGAEVVSDMHGMLAPRALPLVWLA